IAGHIDMFFDSLTTAVPLHQSGKTRVMAVAGTERAPALPDNPTIAESGFPGFRSITSFAMVRPPKIPSALAPRLHRHVVESRALRARGPRPAGRGSPTRAGGRPSRPAPPLGRMTGAPAAAAASSAEETELWGSVIRGAKVTLP